VTASTNSPPHPTPARCSLPNISATAPNSDEERFPELPQWYVSVTHLGERGTPEAVGRHATSKIPVIDEPDGSIPNREQADQKHPYCQILVAILLVLKQISTAKLRVCHFCGNSQSK
jgi:hypothetical protein